MGTDAGQERLNFGRVGATLLFFVLASFAAYWSVIDDFFVSDDLGILIHLSEGRKFDIYSNFVRPLVCASLDLDYRLWGLEPRGYHATGILLHAFNSWAVFAMAWILFKQSDLAKTGRNSLALLSGLLFVVMPGHTEAVTWISGRPDMLGTFFILYSFLAYLLGRERKDAGLYFALSGLLFACALFCKESVIIYPAMIGLFELRRASMQSGTRHLKTLLGQCHWRLIGSFLAIFIAYLGVRVLILGTLVGGYGTNIHLTFDFARIGNNLVTYLTRWLLPFMPSAETYDLVAIGFLTFVAVSVILAKVLGRKRWPVEALFYLLAFYVAAAPVINLGVAKNFPDGERLLYWPSAFVALGFVLVVSYVAQGARLAVVGFVPILAALAFLLVGSNNHWNSAGEFSKRVADRMLEPSSETSSMQYANCLLEIMEDGNELYGERNFAFAWNRTAPPQRIFNCLLAGKEDCVDLDFREVYQVFRQD